MHWIIQKTINFFKKTPENLTALGIDLNARAENLAIADYARLANWLADNPPVDVNKDEILDSEE